MEIDLLFGLPAHPLVVHAAVVLLPLGAIGTVTVALSASARKRLGTIVAIVCIAATLAVGLAQGSGEALEERVRETDLVEAHTHQGETVLPWAIVLTILAIGVAGQDVATRRWPVLEHQAVGWTLAAAVVIVSIGATWQVIDVGHSGAKATWEGTAESS